MIIERITLQVIILRFLGTIMRALCKLLDPAREWFHPFGFGMLSQFLGSTIFNPENRSLIFLDPQKRTRLSFLLNDRCWSSLVIPEVRYERGVGMLLDRILSPETVFIDCGANIGYWSVYTRQYLPPGRIVAIEAYPATYEQLTQNAILNGGFQCLLAAVSDSDGERVWLDGTCHSTMSILGDQVEPSDHGAWVNTITLDHIFHTCLQPDTGRIVLKLDVEGCEIRALSKAQDILKCKPLIIYEDHGKEVDCRNSQYIREVLGYVIYYWDRPQGMREVDLETIRKIKRSRRVGYNFFACHPEADFCLEILVDFNR